MGYNTHCMETHLKDIQSLLDSGYTIREINDILKINNIKQLSKFIKDNNIVSHWKSQSGPRYRELIKLRESQFNQIKQYLSININSSLTESCDELGFNYSSIYQFIKRFHPEFEVNTNNNGKQRKNVSNRIHCKLNESNLDEIKHLYFDNKLTFKQIGKIYNLDAVSICNFFKRYNIKARSSSEAAKLVFEKDPNKREVVRQRMIDHYVVNHINTQPELDFIHWLNANNIKFIQQFRKVGNKHPYDFLLPDFNLLVEIDGSFWHNKPEQIEKDQLQTKQAIEAGFNIVRIDTEQLNKHNGDYSLWLNQYMKIIQK